MKKIVSLFLTFCLVLGCLAFASADGAYTPGTYEASAQGFGGNVKVQITVDEKSITDVVITGDSETAEIGGKAIPDLQKQILEKQSAEIDGVTGASLTSGAVKEAAAAALAQAAAGAAAADTAAIAFKAGTYEATADGYNGPVKLSVTFSDSAVTAVEVVESVETAHVGTSALS